MESFSSLWAANEKISREIEVSVSSHYADQREIPINDDWEEIVTSAFFVALNKMKTIQFLLNPEQDHNYFMESASLARNLWEIWLTLAWLNHHDKVEREKRITQFKNDSIIDQDKLNQTFNEIADREESNYVKEVKSEAQKIRENFEKQLWKMPDKFSLLKDIVDRDARYKDPRSLYYNVVYKDFSHYVHFTWRTVKEISLDNRGKEIIVFPHQSLGFKALDVSCGFFIFITEIWNNVFKVIPDKQFDQWSTDWLKLQGQTREAAME